MLYPVIVVANIHALLFPGNIPYWVYLMPNFRGETQLKSFRAYHLKIPHMILTGPIRVKLRMILVGIPSTLCPFSSELDDVSIEVYRF